MNIYYVYAYLRSNDSATGLAGTPYYIGKGKNRRAYTKHGSIPIPCKSKIVFLETNLTEIGALALERRMIRWWGRKDLGTGILRNKTDGGDGVSGCIGNRGKIRTPEHRLKLSNSLSGLKRSDKSKAKMSAARFGKKFGHQSEEHKLKRADAIRGERNGMYGVINTDEYKMKMSETISGMKWWNDGLKAVRSKECPHGFTPGRKLKKAAI